MQSLALRIVLESDFGSVHELPKAGSPLENPYVYDASARDMKAMASDGLVRIVDELHFDGDGLISRLTFQRLR